MEDTVAVVNAGSDQNTGDGPRGIIIDESTDMSKSSYVVSRWAADTVDLLVEI